VDLISLAITQAEHLGGVEKKLIRLAVRDEQELRTLSLADWENLIGRRIRSKAWNPDQALSRAEAYVRLAGARGWYHTELGDSRYPALLAQIHDPPFWLWWTGEPPSSISLWLAVVGTRSPSEDGRKAAYQLGKDCAGQRIGHVSGLAFGVDAASHAGAVAAGGRSLAVLPGGLNCVAPRGNLGLARQIVANGGWLVSESPPDMPAAPWRFVERNRIIAGLAPALVVVEAPEASGALISARYALDENRDVMVHACGLASNWGAGTRQLREEGAKIYQNMGGIAREYGLDGS
jgi:DNA processing protein